MNRADWDYLENTNRNLLDYTWSNKCRQVQKSLKYNPDPNATVRHHLRDTEEQRKYNDEHYELWGFNEDGTFEYGKYIIFVTPEEHHNLHHVSEETRKKISESNKISKNKPEYIAKAREISKHLWENKEFREKTTNSIRASRTEEFLKSIGDKIKAGYTDESRQKMSLAHKNMVVSDETKHKISQNSARYMLGKHHTDETKQKLREANLGKHHSEETKSKISQNNAKNMLGKHLSEETKKKLREANLGKQLSEETKQKISDGNKGKVVSEETKQKISTSNKGKKHSEESKQKMSKALKEKAANGWNPNKGRKHSEESRKHMSEARIGIKQSEESNQKRKQRMQAIADLYKEYKHNGGDMTWNEFQKSIKLNFEDLHNEQEH